MNLCSFRFDVNVKALFQVSSGHKNLSIKDPDKLISDLSFSCFCCSHSRFNLEKKGVSSACWSAVTRRNDLTPHLFTSSALLHQDRTHSVSLKSIVFWICTESCPRAMYSLSNCLNTSRFREFVGHVARVIFWSPVAGFPIREGVVLLWAALGPSSSFPTKYCYIKPSRTIFDPRKSSCCTNQAVRPVHLASWVIIPIFPWPA